MRTLQILSLILIALSTTAQAIPVETCLGELYSYREAQPEITPPTITIVPQGSQQLKAGELLPLSTEIVSQGQANLVWCAEMGQLLKNSDDLSLINYQAPFNIPEDQVITLGVNADDYGYIGGDNILVYLLKSSSAQTYIVVGTAQGNVLVFSPQGELKTRIASSGDTHTIATFDADNDQADEIIIANDSTLYELNGEISTASLPGEDVFILKADTNGDGNLETITGSNVANEISVNGVIFPVFVSNTRKGKPDNNESYKVDVCHDGKTINIAKAALQAHLNHGDTEGACSSSQSSESPPQEEDNEEDNKDTNNEDNDGDQEQMITICFIPPGNPNAAHTQTVSLAGYENGLKDKSTLGPCEDENKDTDDDDNQDTYGVNVAAGDLNNNGQAEIVAAMASGGSRVETYANNQRINKFDAFSGNNGVLVAVGFVMGNETADIVTAEVNGQEIRIFNGDGVQQGSFATTENIVSLAIARGYVSAQTNNIIVDKVVPDETTSTSGNDSETPEVEKTEEPETQRVVTAPTCQVSSTLNSTCGGQNQTVTDGTVSSKASVSKLVFEGDTTNEGLISNSTISEGSTLTGGELTGYINNQGTLKDIVFSGAEIIGGLLAGTITVERPNGWEYQSLGALRDVSFAPSTVIINAILIGTISGSPDAPATIEGGKIKAGAILSHVIISVTTEIEEDVVMGDGVVLND